MTTPNIIIWSLFRDDNAEYIRRYAQRINDLDYPKDKLRIVCIEGDSSRGSQTVETLEAWAVMDLKVTVLRWNTGVGRTSTTSRAERLACLAQTANRGLRYIATSDWAKFALQLESDLEYQPDLLRRLLASQKGVDADIIAPMVWYGQLDGQFYDIWAYRSKDEINFPPNSRAWYKEHFPATPFQVNSVGSCSLSRMEVLRAGVRLTEDGCIVGYCDQAREKGFTVYVDPTTHILHPWLDPEQLKQEWRFI